MVMLSLLIASILIIQLTIHISFKTSLLLSNVAYFIWIVFVIDYVTRFIISNNKKFFIKNNVIDLVSIIPFHTIYVYISNLSNFHIGKYVILL